MSVSIDIDNNVIVKTINDKGQTVRTSQIHNKATVDLVEGLLRFLCGDFNSVEGVDRNYSTPDEARHYIPTELQFGNVGVNINRNTDPPTLLSIQSDRYKIPTFDDYKLQDRILYKETVSQIDPSLSKVKFDTLEITTFDDPNNSMGLLLRTFIPAGTLVGIGSGEGRKYFTDEVVGHSKGWVYYNRKTDEYETLFTELGLVSDKGTLLARVLLDGIVDVDGNGNVIYDDDTSSVNPIIHSDTTSLVIEWRIGIVSLGHNDKTVSYINAPSKMIHDESLQSTTDEEEVESNA